MTPQINQYVKCYLRNATTFEGLVEEWSDKQVVLKSSKNDDLLIIHNPIADIMLTTIINSIPNKMEQISNLVRELPNIEDPQLKQQSIQQLTQMKLQQEQEIINNKQRQHFSNQGQTNKYSSQLNVLKQLKKQTA